MWSGSWTIRTIPDGPSYVTLNLSRVGGKNYGATDGPMYLCETYPPPDQPERHGAADRRGRERHLPAVHVAKHTGMCTDAVRGIESVQGANCFKVEHRDKNLLP